MKILRDLAIANQGQSGFNYAAFKLILENEQFLKGQLMPLKMRLSVLESFFEPGSVVGRDLKVTKTFTSSWKFSPGTLTIIDLSCPFVGPDDACALFNICVSLFLKGRRDAGRILALDEAHKVRFSFRILGSSSPTSFSFRYFFCHPLTMLSPPTVHEFDIFRSHRFDRDVTISRAPATPFGYSRPDRDSRTYPFSIPSRPMQFNNHPPILVPGLV
jgi:hypothetical protein